MNQCGKYKIIMTNRAGRSHTMTVGGVEAPRMDPLGIHACDDNYYFCDGADLPEDSKDTA